MPPCMIPPAIDMAGTGKTVLVTGGAGYVGSHCIVELLKEDFSVICIDNFVNSIKGLYTFNFDVIRFQNNLYFALDPKVGGRINFVNK